MSVREMTITQLLTAGWVSNHEAGAELDRRERELLERVAKLEARFPVPVEREKKAPTLCRFCKRDKSGRITSDGVLTCWECVRAIEKGQAIVMHVPQPAPATPTDELIAVRVDDATVEKIQSMLDYGEHPDSRQPRLARRILAALKALRDGERK